MIICPDCGHLPDADPDCPTCNGTGKITLDRLRATRAIFSEQKQSGESYREFSERKHPEQQEAEEFFRLVELERIERRPELVLLFHIGNERISKAQAGKMKAAGVRAGVPDYLVCYPSADYKGLALELKAKNGSLSKEQKYILSRFSDYLWFSCCAWGAHEAWRALQTYYSFNDTYPTGPGMFPIHGKTYLFRNGIIEEG
jgi:hypothetical protein